MDYNIIDGPFTAKDAQIAKLQTGRLALLDADRVKYVVVSRISKIKKEQAIRGTADIYLKEELVITETRKWVEEWFEKIDDTILFCFSDSTKNNFRTNLVSQKKYKGNRKAPSESKDYYEGMEEDMYKAAEFIIKNYNSLIVDHLEADDIVSALQDKDNTYIVSNDKDLKQVPGYHYDDATRRLVYVDEKDALKHIIYQMIKGDSTDNIEGLKGKGDKYAQKFLDTIDPKYYFPYLLREYQIHFKSITKGAEAFAENLMLVKMKSDRGDYFKEKYAHMFDKKNMLLRKIHEQSK